MQRMRYTVALGIPLIALLSFTHAPLIASAAWTGPTQPPPGGNGAAPINVGTTDQVKNGSIGVNGLAVFGNSLLGGSTGSNAYMNFGATSGEPGYGIRDSDGLLEFKNSGGSWASIQATVFNLVGGTGSWAVSGNDIYNSNTGNVGIGTANPQTRLDIGDGNLGLHAQYITCSNGSPCDYSPNPEIVAANCPAGFSAISCSPACYDVSGIRLCFAWPGETGCSLQCQAVGGAPCGGYAGVTMVCARITVTGSD